MDRLERLVNLVVALLDADRPLRREELRVRVGGYSDDDDAFRRNFERDKEMLRQMGVPLVTTALAPGEPEEQVGYRIPRERYELADPGLGEEELTALRIAASVVRVGGVGGGAEMTSALRKLGAALGGDDPPPVGSAEMAGGEGVAAVFAAIAERRCVAFAYHGEERVVEPWRLAYRSGRWYLSGWDRGRAAERQFRLDRVEGALRPEGDPGAFELPPGPSRAPVPAWQLGDGPVTPVVVVVDAEQAAWARASAGVAGRDLPDGGVELHLEVRSVSALRSWVLGFLDHAEVVSPPEVRRAVVDWLEELAAVGGAGGEQ